MTSRTLINLGLFALVALLGAIAVYAPNQEQETNKPQPLTDLRPDEIHFIRLSNPSSPSIELEKREDAWHMTAPRQAPANSEKIEQLLVIAVARSHSHFPLPRERLSEFGLDNPPIWLQLNELKMAFGDNDPLQFRRYVRIGDELHLISNGFHHHLIARPQDYMAPSGDQAGK